jgi:hypothetical protein
VKPLFAIAFAQAGIILIVKLFTKECVVRLIPAGKTATAILLLCLVWLGGCRQQPQAAEVPAAEVALVDAETVVAPAAVEVGLQPALTPTAEPVDECLRCHADREMLVDTAKPEEVVISENEGEG